MKRTVLILICTLLTTILAFADGLKKSIELTDAEQQFVTNNNDFAFRLFREVRGNESRVLSPLSITYALGMLNNGAQGVTRQEINQVLGASVLQGGNGEATGIEAINSFCLKLLTGCNLLDKDTQVGIANTIYFNGDRGELSLKTAFRDAALQYYGATPEVRSFSDGQTRNVINQWASDRTEGMIPELIKEGELDFNNPNLVSLLLNAIYFKGAWTKPFEKDFTQLSYFDGMKATAMMMFQNGDFDYAQNDLYQSVILPYGNGAYQMTVFLPRYGKTLDDLFAAMNGQNWNKANYQHYQAFLAMPRIETVTDLQLNEVMKALGMPNAFYAPDMEGFTDFCYFGDDESNSDRVWISLMKQSAKLRLDEVGTEAAAATVIAMEDRAMPMNSVEIWLDRPFLYTISERSTGAIFFMGQYLGEPIQNARHDISLTAAEKQLVSNNNEFAFRLFRKTRGSDNQILSPLSVTYALGLLNNGATGQTKQEINNVLGAQQDDDVINQFCRKMLDEAPTLDQTTKIGIANTIFMNLGYNLKPTFVETANTYYDAEPQTRDFHDGETMDVINQWASDHTEGLIDKILDQQSFDPDYVSYLLNALYFKGTWANKFDQANTHQEAFNGSDVVQMMHQRMKFNYFENDTYQAVQLPYGNKAYKMTVFLPREDKTLDDLLNVLNSSNWKQHNGEYLVDLKLPRFEVTSDIDLKIPLQQLGMQRAFEWDPNGFENFCDVPTWIDLIKQSAIIKVNEEGTEAAAVTVIGYATTSMPLEAEFHANRPFFYIISEQSTGAIFFMGQYVGASGSRPILSRLEEIPNTEYRTENKNIYDLSGRRVNNTQLKKGVYISNGRAFVIK